MTNDEETTQPSPNEVKFDKVVKALLAENHEHLDLKQRLSRLVMEEGMKHPPRKVVYCASHGQFGFNDEFEAFCHSHPNEAYRKRDLYSLRSDPDLIQAISDYGRFICDRFPFILDDTRTLDTRKLDKILSNLSSKQSIEPDVEQDATNYEDIGLCYASKTGPC
jgi:hypothetical protein